MQQLRSKAGSGGHRSIRKVRLEVLMQWDCERTLSGISEGLGALGGRQQMRQTRTSTGRCDACMCPLGQLQIKETCIPRITPCQTATGHPCKTPLCIVVLILFKVCYTTYLSECACTTSPRISGALMDEFCCAAFGSMHCLCLIC